MSELSSVPAAVPASGWLRVTTPEPGYADRVVGDMTRIAGTAAGRALLRQIRRSGRCVLIEQPGAIDPPNALVRPRDLRAATAPGTAVGPAEAGAPALLGTGDGSDCVVAYDPRQWPNPVHPAVPTSDVLLFALLSQALVHLRGIADLARERAREAPMTESEAAMQYRRERGIA